VGDVRETKNPGDVLPPLLMKLGGDDWIRTNSPIGNRFTVCRSSPTLPHLHDRLRQSGSSSTNTQSAYREPSRWSGRRESNPHATCVCQLGRLVPCQWTTPAFWQCDLQRLWEVLPVHRLSVSVRPSGYTHHNLVEDNGIEPLTYCLQSSRSPS
jgi:hypothetical protein